MFDNGDLSRSVVISLAPGKCVCHIMAMSTENLSMQNKRSPVVNGQMAVLPSRPQRQRADL